MRLNLDNDVGAVELIPESKVDAERIAAMMFLISCGRIATKAPTKKMEKQGVQGYIAIRIDRDKIKEFGI